MPLARILSSFSFRLRCSFCFCCCWIFPLSFTWQPSLPTFSSPSRAFLVAVAAPVEHPEVPMPRLPFWWKAFTGVLIPDSSDPSPVPSFQPILSRSSRPTLPPYVLLKEFLREGEDEGLLLVLQLVSNSVGGLVLVLLRFCFLSPSSPLFISVGSFSALR